MKLMATIQVEKVVEKQHCHDNEEQQTAATLYIAHKIIISTSPEITEMYNMKTMLVIFVHMFHSIIDFLLCFQESKYVSTRAEIFWVYL